MSLNSSSVAANINNMYTEYKELAMNAGLDPDTYRADFDAFNFLDKLAEILDAGFQEATPTNPNIIITTPAGTLSFTSKDDIGTGCQNYWMNTLETSGEPVEESQIVSIVNTASTIGTIINNGINGLGRSTISSEPFKDLVDVIFNAVKDIVWSVTEMTPGTPPTTTVVDTQVT